MYKSGMIRAENEARGIRMQSAANARFMSKGNGVCVRVYIVGKKEA